MRFIPMAHTDNLQPHFSSTTVRYWLTFIAFNLLSTLSFAQLGSITGEIRDKGSNETLIGAAVVIKGTLSGASADLDGRYTIAKVTPGSYTLTVQYLGYQPLEVSGVVVTAGESTRVNLYLKQESTSLSEVKVTAEALKTSISTIQMIQKNSLGVMDGLSADQIKKSPDRNTADVLKRTSGTNIQDGKYVVVRGLNERYNLALVNGAMLPGTEPDKKAFSFDLFPSGMLDNLIIIKSAQPDLPGEFAGGIIRINTRDVPDDPFFNISVGTGMNTQATFREYRRMQGSSTDWLGYDKDFRTLPADWPVDRATLVGLPAEQRLALSRQFRNSYATDNRTALPYGSFQMSGGTKALLGPTELGVIGALSYSTSQRVNYSRASGFTGVGGGTGIGDSMGVAQLLSTYNDTAFHTDVNWGAMLNFSARFGPNHRIFLKNAFNITSDNIFTAGRGFRTDGEFVPYRRYQYEFTTNQLLTSQLGGDHSLLKNKLRVDWVASSSRNRRDQPDFRRIRLLLAPNAEGDTVSFFQPQFQPNDADGYRFFAGLTDQVNN
ncbi:MAG: carboxypeptidase-like regulatory domain-containing protein, partial [Bacteroidota bacterium]